MASPRSRVEIVSPYFIPGEAGAKILLHLAAKGVSVSVLTNSLAATDVSAVHGAYARYRKRLIEGGIRLFELRPREARQDISLFGSSGGASLHTKAFLVDDRTGFVGSFRTALTPWYPTPVATLAATTTAATFATVPPSR